jgi:hypothetical protein
MSQTKSQLLSPVGILTASGINVSGVITATSFSGDGSGLTGVSGFSTALSNTSTSPLSKIFYAVNDLIINENTTVDVPETGILNSDGFRVAYTNYADVVVLDTYDLTISDGDELILDIFSFT